MDSSLLKQIQNGKKLKHSETNDRSTPQLGKTSSNATTSSSGASGGGGGGGGGLFGNSKPMLPSQRNTQTNPRIQSTANVKQSQSTTATNARAAPALPARSATMAHPNTRAGPATPERTYNQPQPNIPNGNKNIGQKKDEGFTFHSEKEFPSPIPFSGSRKDYSTTSVKSSPAVSSSSPAVSSSSPAASSSSRQTSSSPSVGFQPIPKQNFPKKAPPPPPPSGPKPTIKRTAPPPPR